MVVLDSTTLLLFLYPSASPPLDPVTNLPVTKAKERIELLLSTLTTNKTRVLIPTPVLSEVLVRAGSKKSEVMDALKDTYVFRIEGFDERAAIELAFLTDKALQSGMPLSPTETKAKIKFDRQIIAIAKVAGVKTIYSDDGGVFTVGTANGMTVVKTADLPLPTPKAQQELFHSDAGTFS